MLVALFFFGYFFKDFVVVATDVTLLNDDGVNCYILFLMEAAEMWLEKIKRTSPVTKF